MSAEQVSLALGPTRATRHLGRLFEDRPLTRAEALAHPWYGLACPSCGAEPGEHCLPAKKPRPTGEHLGACRHIVGAPFCCIHGTRTEPGACLGYEDPRYLEPRR